MRLWILGITLFGVLACNVGGLSEEEVDSLSATAVAKALTAVPPPTPDIPATITAAVEATLVALPTATPPPTPTPKVIVIEKEVLKEVIEEVPVLKEVVKEVVIDATLTPAPAPTPAVNAAPDFEFTLYQGEEVLGAADLRLADLRGKPVVLNFWAGLCPPCRAEMPELQRFPEEFKDQVTIIGVDIGRFTGLGSRQDAQNLLRELNVTYPAGFTNEGDILRNYTVLEMPTTVFITSEGEIFEQVAGALTRETLTTIVERLLQSDTATLTPTSILVPTSFPASAGLQPAPVK